MLSIAIVVTLAVSMAFAAIV